MIGKLNGVIDSYGEDSVILDVNGVGYLVHCSGRTLQELPRVGEAATLSIETYVREDQIRLFGFLTDVERQWFRLLQTVQGVGAKVALAVLGTLKPADLASAIALRDKAMVARTPGVGPKVAERIVTELKDKAPAYADIDPALVRLSGALEERRAPQPVSDAVSALVNLGYGQPQAAAAIAAAARSAGDGAEVKTLIRLGLEGTGEVKRPAKLGKADRALIAAATAAIKLRYRDDWQEVGAALRTRSGKIFTGVNLDAYLGRMAVCAEAVALGRAFVDLGDDGIETIVAVRHPPPDEKDQTIAVVSPCGACRELIFDYDPKARVIVPNGKSPGVVAIGELAAEQIQPGAGAVSANAGRKLVTPERRDEDAAEASLRPQQLAEFIGQEQARKNLAVFIEAARGAQGSARSRAVRRPARARQDHAGADRRPRARRQFPRHVRSGDRQGRRSRRAADQSRRARRSVHRRDPPAQSGGRGNPLSGDGGFSARSHHRRRTGGAFGEDRSRQVHAGRRHHPRRAPDQSAARPLRHSGAAQFLFRRPSSSRSSIAARACSASA